MDLGSENFLPQSKQSCQRLLAAAFHFVSLAVDSFTMYHIQYLICSLVNIFSRRKLAFLHSYIPNLVSRRVFVCPHLRSRYLELPRNCTPSLHLSVGDPGCTSITEDIAVSTRPLISELQSLYNLTLLVLMNPKALPAP